MYCILISFWIKAGRGRENIYRQPLNREWERLKMTEAATKQAEVLVTRPRHSILQNIGALGVAMLIDFADAVPSELLFALGLVPVPVGYEAGVGLVEAAFLNHLGVPIVKVLTLTGADLLPLVDVIPWCTLAVLDTRFGLKIPLLTRLFNY
jgi:hypothetical protein